MSTPPSPAADRVLALLERERTAFLAQIARVPRTHQADRPAPDCWSAAEIAEHVARIDRGVEMLLTVRGAEPPTATADELAGAALTAERVARVRARAERVQAPERVRPTGAVAPEDALAALTEARASLATAYRAADPAVLDGIVHPHPVLGPLTLRGWCELVAHHEARHASQVAEIADAFRGVGAPAA
jgi:hypothetical protein